jgi:hypothetical protein
VGSMAGEQMGGRVAAPLCGDGGRGADAAAEGGGEGGGGAFSVGEGSSCHNLLNSSLGGCSSLGYASISSAGGSMQVCRSVWCVICVAVGVCVWVGVGRGVWVFVKTACRRV